MAELNKDELKRLSPRERLKRLKQLEGERKTEADQIETLIKESMKELRTDEVASEVAPEARDVDIGRLFEAEEEPRLERTIREETREEAEESGPLRYFSASRVLEDYEALQDITYASMMGTMSKAQMESLDQIGERLDRAKYVSASREAADILVASRATLHKIKKYAGLD